MNTSKCLLDSIIPRPCMITPEDSQLLLTSLTAICCEKTLQKIGQSLSERLAQYGLNLPCTHQSAGCTIRLQIDQTQPEETWRMKVNASGILLTGGDAAGIFYGAEALTQVLCVCSCNGWDNDAIPCGEMKDFPRYRWRGFMLDSARHFQPVEQIVHLMKIFGKHRINIFHWHLTDHQGFRTPSKIAPVLNSIRRISPGHYSEEDIAAVRQAAAENFITIVPEIEMPGHCGGLLDLFPQYACTPTGASAAEVCIGKPEARQFFKALITEFAALFPDSPIIHLGGDEASTLRWQNCPDCQKAMQKKNFTDLRQLEADFMTEMASHVISLGRRPMTWFTEQPLPDEVITQCWSTDESVGAMVNRGGEYVYSLSKHCYFDYPATAAEPLFEWTASLPELAVYDAHPCIAWKAALENRLLGIEACMWTEAIPPWRTFSKIVPRLQAWAENAWSQAEQKEFHDFSRRKELLTACGYNFG